MTEFRCNPPLPDHPASDADFAQSITLMIDEQEAGILRWHAPADEEASQGVVQLLTLRIGEPHRRRGLGGDLLNAAIKQARAWHTRRGGKLRRIWIAVEQKHQIIARAFLTGHSFHHTTTITGVCRRQDLLVYVRAFD